MVKADKNGKELTQGKGMWPQNNVNWKLFKEKFDEIDWTKKGKKVVK